MHRVNPRRSTLSLFCLSCLLAVLSAYGDGLPGEYLLTTRWRTLFMGSSPLANPALTTEANYLGARVALTSSLGEFYMHEIGAIIPIGLYQSAAVTWLIQGTGSYDELVFNGAEFTETGKEITDNQNFFVLSYAINPWKRLSVGANVNLAYQNPPGGDALIGVGVDFGLTYRLLRHAILGDHVAGVSFQNLLPPTFGNGEAYSSVLRFSLLSNFWERKIETGFDLSVKDLYAQAETFKQSGTGGTTVDAAKEIEFDMNARLGFWVLRLFNLYGLMGLDRTGFEYWGFAAGFNIPSVNMGRDLAFAYQLTSMAEEDAMAHTFYVHTDLGKHREEVYARKMARLANIAPNLLYNRALALYHAGNFWDAFFIFGRIRAEYPDFFKMDWVYYYMASCQEELDMRGAGIAGYDETVGEYTVSTAIPFANLGLMRIRYRDASFPEVEQQFRLLNTPDTPDSLKFHAYYIMGQAHLRQGEFSKGLQVLSMIPETHPMYVFAQHSSAIANFINGQPAAAAGSLENTLQVPLVNAAQKEIVNRSLVMLGYLFYEHSNQFESALARAVTALRSVPKTSYYYEDALLGLGWTGLKARQWQDCIDAGSVLMKTSNKAVLRAEGALLNAYAFMMQKNFAGALPLLQGASRDLAAFALPSADSVDKAQKDYALTRSEYDVLSDKAKQYSLTTQSSYVIGQIDSLHLHQKSKKTTIDDYLVFSDELIRQKFFSRSLEVVSEDVEYALARAQKMAGLKGAVESQRKMQQKQEAIDSEIDRLKKEMQELNKDRTPFEKVNPKKEQPQPEPAGSESGADTGEPAE